MIKTDKTEKYIDLHMHLDGAITARIAKQLAALQHIALPTTDEKELEQLVTVPKDCASLNDFLSCFSLPLSLLQTGEGLRKAAYLVAEDMKAHGVIYGEIRFAPQLHTRKGMTQREAVQAVLDGLKRSTLKTNIILCCMRDAADPEENPETLELAKQFLVEDGGVVALDLAGAEALYPAENFRELFTKAKEYGLPLTVHAGEAAGAENIRFAVEHGARRIGHGTRAYEDASVLALLREKGIFLEMCPTSNRQTMAVPNMEKYPFMDYLKQGIRVTLNTDDPAIEGTTIADEFRYMEETFGLSTGQEKILLSNSVDAAFTGEAVKAELRRVLGLS